MGRTKGSKNKVIKQKQTQKQIVNVNINQPEKKKRKPRTKKTSSTPVIYTSNDVLKYGQSSLGKPSDSLYYSRPPIVAQAIPAMAGESNILLPPNDTNIERVLQEMKIKTEKLIKPIKKMTDSSTQEILNIEPTTKLELKPEQLSVISSSNKIRIPRKKPFTLTGEIVQRKHTDMQTDAPKINLTDTGSTEVFTIPSKIDDYKKVLTKANKDMESIIKTLSKKNKKSTMETQTEPKSVSSVATETMVIGPTHEEKKKAADKINAAASRAIMQNVVREQLAVNKLSSVMASKLNSEKLKTVLAGKTLVNAAKRTRIQKKYNIKRDQKEESTFNKLEGQLNNVEEILKVVRQHTKLKPLIKVSDLPQKTFNVLSESIKKVKNEKLTKPLINISDLPNQAYDVLSEASKPKQLYSAQMVSRQLMEEENLRKLQLEKDNALKEDAAIKLQSKIKRLKPQNDLNQIKQAKEVIGGRAKALLTGKADFLYSPKLKKSMIIDKSIVGKPLAVATRGKKLVSKKKQGAAIEGAAIRKDFLDLQRTYKPIMKK